MEYLSQFKPSIHIIWIVIIKNWNSSRKKTQYIVHYPNTIKNKPLGDLYDQHEIYHVINKWPNRAKLIPTETILTHLDPFMHIDHLDHSDHRKFWVWKFRMKVYQDVSTRKVFFGTFGIKMYQHGKFFLVLVGSRCINPFCFRTFGIKVYQSVNFGSGFFGKKLEPWKKK